MRIRTIVLAVLAALASVSSAQEPAPPPAESAATPPATPPAPPPAQNRPPVDNDEFIPTQELAADEAVTFPVDI